MAAGACSSPETVPTSVGGAVEFAIRWGEGCAPQKKGTPGGGGGGGGRGGGGGGGERGGGGPPRPLFNSLTPPPPAIPVTRATAMPQPARRSISRRPRHPSNSYTARGH